MSKRSNIATELTAESLEQVYGGRYWPYPPGRSIPHLVYRGVREAGTALGKAASAVGKAAESVWDTFTGWF